jgi:glycogen debranching enzyme/putative sterol carrier protein
MSGEMISILEGNTFVVSDRRGDVDASPDQPHGLFHQDTRFLSKWRLRLDGSPLGVLSTDDVAYFKAQFFLVPASATVYVDSPLSIIRKRSVGEGFHEDITVLNHLPDPVELELRFEAAADFADIFEVKDALEKRGEHYRRVEAGKLVLGYRRDGFARETWIQANAREGEILDDGIRFAVHIDPHGEWTTCLDVVTAIDALGEAARSPKYGHGETRARPNMRLTLEEWLDAAPRLTSDWRDLELSYERSLVDLAALRFYFPTFPGNALPAAGLPWFMTVFGRDSLITSYQALPFAPDLAETTLRVLAAGQGRFVDHFRDEEPGKILHELRLGEMTAFEERPHSPYFGAADATPLFLILLDETERWTGNTDLVRELEPDARAALAWIDQYGDRDGDGYVEYERRNNESGLENQCWKDSWNSIVFADGSLASLPRATCEIQGYVYDAKVRCGRLAREVWDDPDLAARLESDAAALKRRFNEDFWLSERGCFALALDGAKRRVDSLTSNIGHLLWSGIADDDKAAECVHHLMGDDLFSGWGVRTLAEGEGAYNPLGYHVGTVWPHDNSLIAAGLARYGYRREAARISFAMLEAAAYFRHRLPEVFAGYPREQTRFPVEYPTACSPQAWASGTPLLFVSILLGLDPSAEGFRTDPVLPDAIGRLELTSTRKTTKKSKPSSGLNGQHAIVAAAPMPDFESARDFFERAELFIDPARTQSKQATYRFDIVGAGSWRIAVDDGTVSVSEGDAEADYVLRLDEDLLLRILRGEQSSTTAFLTGQLIVEGDLTLAPLLDQILSPLSQAAERRAEARARLDGAQERRV